MSGAAPDSAAMLRRIADGLGLPVAAFTRPADAAPTPGRLGDPLRDPDGVRLAAAFGALPPETRRWLADIAVALVPAAADPAHPPEKTVRAAGPGGARSRRQTS